MSQKSNFTLFLVFLVIFSQTVSQMLSPEEIQERQNKIEANPYYPEVLLIRYQVFF